MEHAPELLPCPFCGRGASDDLSDTLYPTGVQWTTLPGGLRHYHSGMGDGDGRCYAVHCPESEGGCGAEVSGDSRDDAIAAWNRRASLADSRRVAEQMAGALREARSLIVQHHACHVVPVPGAYCTVCHHSDGSEPVFEQIDAALAAYDGGKP